MSYEQIIEEIESIRSRINHHPAYYSKIHDRSRNWLTKESNRHSLAIEGIISPKKSTRKKGKGKKKCVDSSNLEAGWNHLKRYGVNLASLSTLGHLIEPIGHPKKTFRKSQNLVGLSSPPKWEIVPYLIENLLYQIKDINVNPVIKSIEFHLEYMLIHPYDDGNGRTTRLVQNFMLQSAGYSPCLIPRDERGFYIKELRSAIFDRESKISHFDEPSDNELNLKSYLSEKVLNTTKSLETELNKQNIYEVNLSCRGNNIEPGFYHHFSNIFRTYNRMVGDHEKNVTVSLTSKVNCPKLRIEGDITKIDIERILDRQTDRKKGSLKGYSIETIFNGRKK